MYTYKGYSPKLIIDVGAEIIYGVIGDIEDKVTFEIPFIFGVTSINTIQEKFELVVNHYIEICETHKGILSNDKIH